LKPSATGCEILDEDQLETNGVEEKIIGSAAIANGRIYFASEAGLYCIGKKGHQSSSHTTASTAPAAAGTQVSSNPATFVQVVPTELILKPGDKVNFRVRLFDAQGNFIREEPA